MRSFNSRFVSPIVMLALLAGSVAEPAFARNSAGPAGGGSSGGGSSSGTGGSGTVNIPVLHVQLPVRLKPIKYDRCEYDSTGQLEFAPTGQPCPNTL
jgi:hypothetical protein